MIKKYPLEFTLDNDTHVVVNKTGPDTYEFSLTPKERPPYRFTYKDDKPKAEVDETLHFEQLNALRTFWLKNEDVI